MKFSFPTENPRFVPRGLIKPTGTRRGILRGEISLVFSQILEQCGVFARIFEDMAQFDNLRIA